MPNFRLVGDYVQLWSLLVLEPSSEPGGNNDKLLLLHTNIRYYKLIIGFVGLRSFCSWYYTIVLSIFALLILVSNAIVIRSWTSCT